MLIWPVTAQVGNGWPVVVQMPLHTSEFLILLRRVKSLIPLGNTHENLFLNFENFTDTRQSRYGSIYSGPISDPQFTDIYAPLDGFVINGGVKLRF